MFAFIIVFLSSLFWPALPSIQIMATVVLMTIITAFRVRFQIKTWIFGAILGFLWAGSVGHWYSSWQLPNRYFNENVIIEATVQSLQLPITKVQQRHLFNSSVLKSNSLGNSIHGALLASAKEYGESENRQFEHKTVMLKLSKIGKTTLYHSPLVKLSWFQPSMLFEQGDKVRLVVNMKKPHALANEFGFNRQKWLASQNIVAVGSVKASPTNAILMSHSSIRQNIVNRLLLDANKYNLKNTRWILALGLGERGLFTDEDWKLLQTSGTAHLFAISGLHLGIVSLLFFNLTKACFFFAIKILGLDHQPNIAPWAIIVSIPFCFFYAYLSGFQIPVIRSALAIVFIAYLMFYQLHWRPIAVIICLLMSFFLLFPLSIIGISFWFSFGAIFAILFFMWRFPRYDNSLWEGAKQAIFLQLFLSLIMLPLVAFNFGMVSTVSALVNLIVMPVVSMLLVPLCLGLIVMVLLGIDAFMKALLLSLDYCFEQLISFMRILSTLPNASMEVHKIPSIAWLMTLIVLLLMFLPFWPHRKKIIAALCIAIITQSMAHNAVEDGWSVRVFDIGQGLSVLVRQHNRFLLYDTGQSFISGGNLAQSVIAPYFEAETHFISSESHTKNTVPSIDYLINSHMDNDHAGGNAFVFSRYNVTQWLTPAGGCTSNDSFTWGDLSLQMLWPDKTVSGEENNHSCVIKISGKNLSLLLTGDIEAAAERLILNKYADLGTLQADVLVAAHHGSKTSSTLSFVNAVSPKYVVISSKYLNRWQFPHPSVTANFKEVNAKVFNTAFDGEVVFEYSNGKVKAQAYRQRWFTPWYMRIQRSQHE
jgi:competence protein ComEC